MYSTKNVAKAIELATGEHITSILKDKELQDYALCYAIYKSDRGLVPWLKDNEELRSLHLGSTVAKELARIVCSEVNLVVQGESERAKYLNKIARYIEQKLPRYAEQGIALGTGVLKPTVNTQREIPTIGIQFVRLSDFLPLRVNEDGVCIDSVFLSDISTEDFKYTRLERHTITDDGYKVTNLAFESVISDTYGLGRPIELSKVPEWADLKPEAVLDNVTTPLYGLYTNPIANLNNLDSPLGMSIYSTSKDLLEEADLLWEQIWFEVKSGERKIFAPPSAFSSIKGDTYIMKRFYKELDIEDQNFIHDFSPALRNSEMSSRMQEIMRRIEENCGLSYGIISDPVEVAHTATEVKHSKERLMATVTSIQNALHAALNFTIQACSDLCDLYKITPAGDWELVCEWDDSVIESREEKSARALQELQNGLIDEVEYFVQTRGMSLEEATEYVNEIKKRKPDKPQGVDWFGGGGA